jgi:hypothetical protein
MVRDNPSPPNSSLRYLGSVKRTATDFWDDQLDNWSRIWGRVQTDDYTFGKWVHDALQTWDGWMYGASRLGSLPTRQFENVLPTLTLLTDTRASVGPQAELPTPDDFEFGDGANIGTTAFSLDVVDDNFKIEPVADSNSKTVIVKIVPKPGKGRTFSEACKGLKLEGKIASAVLYQGNRPFAVVDLAFKRP